MKHTPRISRNNEFHPAGTPQVLVPSPPYARNNCTRSRGNSGGFPLIPPPCRPLIQTIFRLLDSDYDPDHEISRVGFVLAVAQVCARLNSLLVDCNIKRAGQKRLPIVDHIRLITSCARGRTICLRPCTLHAAAQFQRIHALRLDCSAQRALLPVAVGAMNIHDVPYRQTDRRKTSDAHHRLMPTRKQH